MTQPENTVTKKNMRARGRRAYMHGISRDGHNLPKGSRNLENWLYGYDLAAKKNNYAVMPLRGKDPHQQTVIKTGRVKIILELCKKQPYNSRELADLLEVTESCLRGYVVRLTRSGDLVKWRSPMSLSKGRPNTYYAIRMEQFEGFEDAPVRPVVQTWKDTPPPMYEPMALLFGRAA